MPDETQRVLTAAIKTMEIYDYSYRRNINKLEGLTARYWPELTQYLTLQSAILLELLIEYGSPVLVVQAPSDAKQLMRKVGSNFLKKSKIEAVVASASNSLGVKGIDAEQEQLRALCKEIRRLQKKRQHAKGKVEALTQEIEGVRKMTPVLGKMTAAILFVI
jgi:RNA processing factor Prp31